jgi:hypothetical protein
MSKPRFWFFFAVFGFSGCRLMGGWILNMVLGVLCGITANHGK